MNGVIQEIIITILGFVIGGLALVGITTVTLKFIIQRVVDEITKKENKGKISEWIEDVVAESIAKSQIRIEKEKKQKPVSDDSEKTET
ncbi:MAG: hypothetical protein ACOC5T_05250 [Elusimicrobiota bacterium]